MRFTNRVHASLFLSPAIKSMVCSPLEEAEEGESKFLPPKNEYVLLFVDSNSDSVSSSIVILLMIRGCILSTRTWHELPSKELSDG
jgi:hypothetical protein